MDQIPAPFCQPSDTDAAILTIYRNRFHTAPLGRWATEWSDTMDPFEGLWFKSDGTGVQGVQPGCDYNERSFSWLTEGPQCVRLHFPAEEPEFEAVGDPGLLLQYDFEVRRNSRQVDVVLVSTLPTDALFPWGFRLLDWPLIYVGGPNEAEKPVRWSLWGGIKYFP